ncbi:MAG: protein translocase subunit SecD, partial [Clostridiales bacterium]|nr:protein translocase subunit SecD [Clostridiales bacterium]
LIGRPALLEFRNPDDESADAYVTGEHVVEATVGYDENNSPVVVLKFDDEGTELFRQATEARQGKSLGIYINGTLITSPTVNSTISNGEATITGVGSYADCEALALQIQSGAFSVNLEILENRTISATLGDSAIKMSVIAGIIGIILIMAFMVLLYRLLGAAASIALCAYVVLTIMVLAILPWVQLTLSGIGGMILGIGMAVDANIVIFERIKDEYEKGKPLAAAVTVGFKRAGRTIIDSNLTTIIGALALLIFGPASLQSFAITLMVSIVLSFITALVLTRRIVKIFLAFNNKNAALYNLRNPKDGLDKVRQTIEKLRAFKITKKYKRWFSVPVLLVSVAFIVFTIVSLVNKDAATGVNLGIDFTGGSILTVDLGVLDDKLDLSDDAVFEAEVARITAVIEENGFRASQPQRIEGNIVEIRYQNQSIEENDKIIDAVYQYYHDAYDADGKILPRSNINTYYISASSSAELLLKALLAVAVALLLTLVYIAIRFKWRYGVAAVLTLIHDVILLIAAAVILRLQVNSSFIAAIVTIIGYSINNVIVVFDRIRENLSYEENKVKYNAFAIADNSIVGTVTRSAYTTFTTLITIVMLAILGGQSMREFALPIIVGLMIGLFSSLFVAPSIWSLFVTDGMRRAAEKRTLTGVKPKLDDYGDEADEAGEAESFVAEPIAALADGIAASGATVATPKTVKPANKPKVSGKITFKANKKKK